MVLTRLQPDFHYSDKVSMRNEVIHGKESVLRAVFSLRRFLSVGVYLVGHLGGGVDRWVIPQADR